MTLLAARMTAQREPTATAAFSRAAWRLMPLLFICYVVAYLDRDNVGFAKLQMLNDLHFAASIISALPMFWALPTSFLGGAGAAAGIALINSTGNLAGFVSPTAIGWLVTQTHSIVSGLFLVAGTLTLAALLIVLLIPARIVNR